MEGESPEHHPIPQPDEVPYREREAAMGGYLTMFASIGAGLPFPLINLLASYIYYHFLKKETRFVRYHTLHSFLAQIPISLLNAGLVLWTVRILWVQGNFSDLFFGYLWAVVLANLTYFVFSIVAAVRARNGRFFYFLFFGRLAFDLIYKVEPQKEKEEEKERHQPVNRPPS